MEVYMKPMSQLRIDQPTMAPVTYTHADFPSNVKQHFANRLDIQDANEKTLIEEYHIKDSKS